jgi:hypothetical protein
MSESAPRPIFEPEPEQTPNYHELARQRAWLRHNMEDLGVSSTDVLKRVRSGESVDELWKEGGGLAQTMGPHIMRELQDVEKSAGKFSVEEEGGLSDAVEIMRLQKEEAQERAWVDDKKISREIGPAYATITEYGKKDTDITNYVIRRSREARYDPYANKAHAPILAAARTELGLVRQEEEKLTSNNPDAARAVYLASCMRGLKREGHVAETPQVAQYLEEIGKRMIAGKSMFLHGPTGTGKTSLARLAAKRFSGQSAEMVYCNPQTREANIWGKTGIRPVRGGAIETVDIYGPLTKAMQAGKVAIFDEFTALPREQMVFIKGIMNAKAGDAVNVMGNGQIEIAPGFQMIFTANLKSEKNPERQEMPPEIAREFEQNNLKVEYTPPDESYDIMLARLQNSDGSIDLSQYDLNVTLPKLCEGMADIQKAYEGQVDSDVARLIGVVGAGGKAPSLKKFVLTQGTVENILDGWKTDREGVTFSEYLDRRLKVGLTFEEYPAGDRELAAKILAAKGLLRTLTSRDLGLSENIFDMQVLRQGRADEAIEETIQKSGQLEHLSIRDVVRLDPFHRRASEALERAGQFLTGEEGEHTEITGFQEALELLGEDHIFGPEQVRTAFGIEFENIPAIPFSREMLEACRNKNIDLILYADKLPDGSPLTGNNLIQSLNNTKTTDGKPFIYNNSLEWLTAKDANGLFKESCFMAEVPELRWKLVSREVLDNSKNLNYLEQTQVLIENVQSLYTGAGTPMSANVRQAIEEFDRTKPELERLISSDWQQAADMLEALEINQLFRETLVEAIFRAAIIDRTQKKLPLGNTYSWTKSRSSGRGLVGFGYVGHAGGASAFRWDPGSRRGGVGCVLSAANF